MRCRELDGLIVPKKASNAVGGKESTMAAWCQETTYVHRSG